MSNDKRDSDRATKKRPSWRDMLGRSNRDSKTLETSERPARGVESGDEGNDTPAASSDRKGQRDGRQTSRPGGMGAEETGGISPGPADGSGSAAKDEDEDITGVIEVNLAEVRRQLDEIIKKD